MSDQGRLYNSGFKPVYKVSPSDDHNWEYIPGNISWKVATDGFQIRFDHRFEWDTDQTVYFAFSYPFSYQEWIEKIDRIEEACEGSENIYFYREWLAHSLENRQVELLTITDFSEITDEEEQIIKGWFPLQKKEKKKRPFVFNKPTVFLTGRVHPGETPASHTLNGIIDIITDEENWVGKELRKHFVFKIVPIINPDGVYRGYYRVDTKGQNLNRFYTDPKSDIHPTIYAIKKAVEQQHESGKLKVYHSINL